MSLTELESVANDAYQAYSDADNAVTAATEKTAAAEQAYYDALNQHDYGDMSGEGKRIIDEARQALEDAKAEEAAAVEARDNAAVAAGEAMEDIEKKKRALRLTRMLDTTYVVHCARIECSNGMRESYLVLGPTHGVKTHQIPQLTVQDTILDTNIINFGGCHSMENPSVQEAAEEAVREAKEAVQNKERTGVDKFFDKVVGWFVKDQEIEVDESLMQQCVGKCCAQFPAGTEWVWGHEKVTINGKPVLLRRCSLMCNYGGYITILLSGQPESQPEDQTETQPE